MRRLLLIATLLSTLTLHAALAVAAAPDGWTLRADGIGPLRIGMRFDQANAVLGGGLRRSPAALLPTRGCEQLGVPRQQGVSLMFIDDVLERIDVDQPGIATNAGLAVGMPIETVAAAHPHVASEPNAYAEQERYLTVRAGPPSAAATDVLALRFLSEKGRIGAIIAGRLQEVRYIEGCL